VAVNLLVLILIGVKVPSVRGHLKTLEEGESAQDKVVWVLKNKDLIPSFLFMFLLVVSAFSVVPFIGAYLNLNVGVASKDLYWVYLVGGSVTFFSAQAIGRMADRWGKLKVFQWVASFSVIPMFIFTTLPVVPLGWALVVTSFFMILVSGRFIPAMALLTNSVDQNYRGTFMSVITAVQHAGAGLAAWGVGMYLQTKDTAVSQPIVGFWHIGISSVLLTLICVFLAPRIYQVTTRKDF
jgi:predicted MFS family arabinose efflux permease